MRLSKNIIFFTVGLMVFLFVGELGSLTPSISDGVQAQTTTDRKSEALRLHQTGGEQLNRGQFREALETFGQVLGIVREVGDRRGEGTTLNNIGLVYSNLGQLAQALKFYEQALVISKEVGNKAGVGTTLNNIGSVYHNLGQLAQALKFYEQALVIHKEVGDKAEEGTTLNNIGEVYRNLGQLAQALKFLEQALVIRKEVGDKAGVGTTLNNIGGVYHNLGQYPQALKFYEQALVIRKEVGDKAGVGRNLNNIGAVYDNMGQLAQALKFYEQALVISKEVGDKAGSGTILNNIGLVYDNMGQYAQALKFLEQALVIRKEVGDKAGEGETLNNIGLVYDNMGQLAQALKFYEQALVIHKEVGNKVGVGTTLNNIGSVYLNLGQLAQALKFYEQALVIVKEVGDKAGVGRNLNNIGEVYRNLGQLAQALKFYEQALVIHKEVGNKVGVGTTLNNIGSVYLNLGQLAQALKFYSQALVIVKEVGDKAGVGGTLNNIGSVYISLGQYAEAEKALFDAIAVLEDLRGGLTDADKIAIFETQANTYRFLLQALVAQNKTNTALEIAERSRARAIVELLASRLSENPNNKPTIAPPTLQQIQQIAKEQNATLVQYSIVYDDLKIQQRQEWRESELYIWVINPAGEIIFKQVDLKNTSLAEIAESGRVAAATDRGRGKQDTAIANLVTGTREAIAGFNLEAQDSQTKPIPETKTESKQLKELYNLLIQPIAELLPADPNARVIFIPQSSLFLVPFPALQDPAGKYLIEKHTILTSPSIQVLELTHQQRNSGALEMVVVGNPTMPLVGVPPTPLRPLPYAEKEAVEIAKMVNTQPLIGNQATETSLKQLLPKARLIHLATHGSYDDEVGLQSWIALTPTGNEDGLLTADEILDLKLNADLVVLSACDTGRGRITGDGVVGLSRSFINAGVSSIVVSLWSVGDDSTSVLMKEFYRQLQSNPDKARALRQAMLTTKAQPQYSAPLHWAAFTLIGEAE